MEYRKDTAQFQMHQTVVSLGKFDGVHRGHRVLLDYMKSLKKYGFSPVVFTFSPSPESYFSKKQQQLLYTEEEKRGIMEALGMDAMISYPFDAGTADMSAADFVRDILVGKLEAKVVAAGRGFHFGKNREGDGDFLKEAARKYGFEIKLFDKLGLGREAVSSSRIRECLAEGNIEGANQMLGQPYFITGEVLHGRQLGRTLGMPTINLSPPIEKLLPPNGVYLSRVLFDNASYAGITNIGCKPTVEAGLLKNAETYLYGYEGDLYGKNVCVELYEYVRSEKKFASLDDLKRQMHEDMRYGARIGKGGRPYGGKGKRTI